MALQYLKNIVTLEYDPAKCTGCGRCAEVCPHGVFVMVGDKALLTDRDDCMECGACSRNCSPEAVRVRAGVGCAWAIARSRLLGKPEVSCCG